MEISSSKDTGYNNIYVQDELERPDDFHRLISQTLTDAICDLIDEMELKYI